MIENELKYVLNLDTPKPFLSAGIPNPVYIEQGYIGPGARVRSIEYDAVLGKTQTPSYTFTYKWMSPNLKLEEFEQTISEEEFLRCYQHADKKVSKKRYSFKNGDVQWDLDYFLNENKETYFCMAECEMPVGMAEPDIIPPTIAQNIIKTVSREDAKDFTNDKLSDKAYAKSILKKLSKLNLILNERVVFHRTGCELDGVQGWNLGKHIDDPNSMDYYIISLNDIYEGKIAVVMTEACIKRWPANK